MTGTRRIPADQLRIVPTVEITTTAQGQQDVIRAAQGWDTACARLDGIGQEPINDLVPEQTGFAVFYLREETTVHDLTALMEAVRPHVIGEPTFCFQPHFRQEVAK